MAVNPYGWASPNTQGMGQQDNRQGNVSAAGMPDMNVYSNVNQGQPFNYSPPSMSDTFSGFLGGSVPSGDFNEDFWRSQKSAGAFQAYSQNLMQPLMNYYLQNAGQQFQNAYNQATLNEQIRLNNLQNALAQAASGREERALAANLGFNERDFAEAQRQFNQRFGLDERELALQRQLGMGRLGLDRDSLALQRELGMGELGLGRERLGLDTRRLNLEDAYRYAALQQEADLMRQRLANELTQSRYAAFGRSQAPSFRMMNTF